MSDAGYARRLPSRRYGSAVLPLDRRGRKLSRGTHSAVGIVVGLASRAPLTRFDEPAEVVWGAMTATGPTRAVTEFTVRHREQLAGRALVLPWTPSAAPSTPPHTAAPAH